MTTYFCIPISQFTIDMFDASRITKEEIAGPLNKEVNYELHQVEDFIRKNYSSMSDEDLLSYTSYSNKLQDLNGKLTRLLILLEDPEFKNIGEKIDDPYEEIRALKNIENYLKNDRKIVARQRHLFEECLFYEPNCDIDSSVLDTTEYTILQQDWAKKRNDINKWMSKIKRKRIDGFL